MPDLLSPKRSAHASIRGYLYQSLLGVERWLSLGADGEGGDALLCEGDEDLHRLFRGDISVSEQVKDYGGKLGIGDRVLRETLARWVAAWVELKGRGVTRRFVFVTTAEKRSTRGGVDVLELWDEPLRRAELILGVKEWVATVEDEKGAGAKALAWLDEHEAWSELIESIQWHFDAPGWDRTRQEIARQLTRRDLAAPVHDLMIDRLLARVLEASVQKEVADRVLTADDLEDLLVLTKQELRAWIGEEGRSLRKTLDEAHDLPRLLSSGRRELPDDPQPSELLTARYEVVPFDSRGREGEIELLEKLCSAPAGEGVLLLHGPGGAGKTRLMIHHCRRLRHNGWYAGFLDGRIETSRLDPLFEGTTPRLVVIDYGETRPDLVATVIRRMDEVRETSGPKIRLVLLARSAGGWWKQLREDDLRVDDLARGWEPREVRELVAAEEDRSRVVKEAAAAYAAVRKVEMLDVPEALDLSDERYQRPLYLHVEALLSVLGGAHEGNRPLAQILVHERRGWWSYLRTLTGAEEIPESLRTAANQVMAALTLTGGVTAQADADALFQAAASSADHQARTHLRDLFRRFYAGQSGRFLGSLEPDLLGEDLIRQVLAVDISLLDRVLEIAKPAGGTNALVVVGRLLRDETLPIELAQSVMGRFDVELHLPVSLQEAALAASERVLADHVERHPKPTGQHLAERARIYNNLSIDLGALGRREEALKAIEEAVTIRRELAAARPDAFRSDLATSLNNLSNRLSNLGRWEEALKAIAEAVEIYRALTVERPDAFQPNLATSLNTLSVRLSAVGLMEEAIEAVEEAVEIRRGLAAEHPDAFRPALATSLHNLSQCLTALKRLNDARLASEEALRLLRPFFLRLPGAFLSSMAKIVWIYANLCEATDRTPNAELLDTVDPLVRELEKGAPDPLAPTPPPGRRSSGG